MDEHHRDSTTVSKLSNEDLVVLAATLYGLAKKVDHEVNTRNESLVPGQTDRYIATIAAFSDN